MTAVSGNDHVVVTGIGLLTAAGIGVGPTWEAVLGARSVARHDPELAGLAVDFACRAPDFRPEEHLPPDVVRRTDRCAQLSLVAMREALRMAGLDPDRWDGARVGVVIGSAFGGIGTLQSEVAGLLAGRLVSPVTIPRFIPNMLAGQVSLSVGASGPGFVVSTACASGTSAIGLGRDLLLTDRCDIVLAGGSDAPVNRIAAAGFARMDALSHRTADPGRASRPFDAGRDGFVLGEGAAVLVLERAADATVRGARRLAAVAGYGASTDAHHLTSPHPEGVGLERAIRAALGEAGATPSDVDHINAHATGTPVGDAAEGSLLTRLFGDRPVVTANKGALGHTMGAAGAIEAALTVLAVGEQVVPPIANLEQPDPALGLDLVRRAPRRHRTDFALSTSSGFGGQNAVIALTPS